MKKLLLTLALLITSLPGCSLFTYTAPPVEPVIQAPEPVAIHPQSLNQVRAGSVIMEAGNGIWFDDHLFLLHPKYDALGSAKAHRPGDGLGILDWTAGSDLNNLRTYLRNAQVNFVRIHLINTVCVRNSNCGGYEIGKGYSVNSFKAAVHRKDPKIINHLKNRTKVFKTFFQSEFPNVAVYMSPFLEHNGDDQMFKIGMDSIWDVWSLWGVNNPLSGRGIKGYKGITLLEDHSDGGLTSESNIVSTDGHEIMDMDSMKYARDTNKKQFRGRWSRRNNCRHQGNFQDPRQRTSCMNQAEAEQQAHVTDEPGTPPARGFACTVKPFDNKNIWKPLAEDKGHPDARKNLPVIIPSHLGHRSVSLVGSNGKSAGSLGYYGKFTDGRPRSYSGHAGGTKHTGYGYSQSAIAVSGSPWVWAKEGNKCVGPFHPGRRQGEMRD